MEFLPLRLYSTVAAWWNGTSAMQSVWCPLPSLNPTAATLYSILVGICPSKVKVLCCCCRGVNAGVNMDVKSKSEEVSA